MKLELQIQWGFNLAPSHDTVRKQQGKDFNCHRTMGRGQMEVIHRRHVCCQSKTFQHHGHKVLLSPGPGPDVDPGDNPQEQSTGHPCPHGAKTPVRDIDMKQTRKEHGESEKLREGLGICCSGPGPARASRISQSEKENQPAGQTVSISRASRALWSQGHGHLERSWSGQAGQCYRSGFGLHQL